MRYQVLDIQIDYEKIGVNNEGFQPKLTVYLPDNSPEIDINRKRPMVIVCPGGAYALTSDREAEPIALKYLSAGIAAAVLRYSVGTAKYPAPQLELAKAVAMVRENAETWNIDSNKIIVSGFSAGGHLAASYSTLWNRAFITEYFGYHNQENKPNGMILSYPVITSGPKAHRGSFEFLLGDKKNDPELLEMLSVEKQVTADTPPAFIWHTCDDQAVPVENSLMLASAMVEAGINVELHIFPKGVHGLSLANRETSSDEAASFFVVPECQVWIDMAIRWVENL